MRECSSVSNGLESTKGSVKAGFVKSRNNWSSPQKVFGYRGDRVQSDVGRVDRKSDKRKQTQ